MMKKVLLTGGACLLAVTAFCQLQSATFADRVQIQDMEIQTQHLLKGLWMLTNTGANQHQGTAVVGLQRKNYFSSAGSGDDYNDKVGIWLKGYYQNLGGAMPIYIGGDGFNTDDCKMMVDRSGNVGIGTVDAGTFFNLNQASYPTYSGSDKVLAIHSSAQPVLELARNVTGAAAGTRVGGLYFTNTTAQQDAHRQLAGIWTESRISSGYPTLPGGRLVFMTKVPAGGTQQKMIFDESGCRALVRKPRMATSWP
ncbi:hypothetical protein MKQ70_05260 [Chitinophaga sedimenti]|uniref:hypothetical protein n=1 Tax=Chitinophaga sedimenti TaxID=2033606 RepID=UPI002006987A|nr:hypothetical protein [Chitinophaga sedimenti]MCK7554443.1 hypothetical protein [Chitinophaga sedimenti]